MDFLEKASGQLLDLFRSMTPGTRLTTGLLLVAIVISLTYLLRFDNPSPNQYLFGAEPLTQREIDTMRAAFGKAGLNDFEVENHRVRVPQAQRHTYLAALSEGNAFPQHPGASWDQMFASNSPLEGRDVRQLKARRAKEQGLESTVRKMTGIDEAYVEIEEINKGGIPPRKEQRALVSVRANGNDHLDERLISSIRQAVAYGGGVEVENVTVLDLNSGLASSPGGVNGLPGSEDNAYADALRRYETMYKDKIEQLLSMVQGIRVRVFVELDKNLRTRTNTRKYDSQPVAIRTEEVTKDSSSSTPQNQGRPGVASNGLGNQPQSVSPPSPAENTLTETRTKADSIIGATEEMTELAPLVPQYVKAAIYVPRSYFERVWRQENPPVAGADPIEPDNAALKAIETRVKTSIQETVAAVLPEPAPGKDPFPRVRVETYTETPMPSPVGPSLAENVTTWFSSNWQTLGMFLLAIVGIVVLRGMLKSTMTISTAAKSESGAASRSTAAQGADPFPEDHDAEDISNSLKERFQHSGRSLRDELAELVKEDPDAAANVLQIWIGDAA